MSPGKACAKALQAGLNSFAKAPSSIQDAYLADGEGTQVILIAHSDEMFRAAYEQAAARCVPCVIYEETIGIGPVTRHEVEHITREFELFR